MAKKNAAPTKSQIVSAVADQTDLSKKQVGATVTSSSAPRNDARPDRSEEPRAGEDCVRTSTPRWPPTH